MRLIFPRFFAKQSEDDFYRLGDKIQFAQNCLSCKFAAGHLLNIDCGRWGGAKRKKRATGIFERLGIYSERGERAINPKSAAADV